MNAFFEKEYQLRNNDFDSNNRILPSTILDLFQSVAGEHAIHIGVGYNELLEKNLAWVMTKVKFEIIAPIEKYSSVKVKTWPLKNGRVTFEREYIIYNENQNVLIKGSSEWVTIDIEKRRIASPGKLYNLSDDEFLKEKNFEGKFFKVPSFDADGEGFKIRPSYTDFDINCHVNNTKYADFILNAYPLKVNEEIRTMQIDYHLEIKETEEISVYYKKETDTLLFAGKNKNGQLNFSAYIKNRNG